MFQKLVLLLTLLEIKQKFSIFMVVGSFHLTSQNSDQHQDKYEYNQTNYRNKEMLHILKSTKR